MRSRASIAPISLVLGLRETALIVPFVLQAIGQLLPATPRVALMRGIVLRNAGPEEMALHVLARVLFSVVLVWASMRRVSKMTV